MASDMQRRGITPGIYAVIGHVRGYFLTEHDEPLNIAVRNGRVAVPEACDYYGNAETAFVPIERTVKRSSKGVSLIDPDMPRPLSPEQMAMRQMQNRMLSMEIALKRREHVTPRQIEEAVAEPLPAEPEAEPAVENEEETE